MPPPAAKKKSSRNRVVLAIGAVALLVLGYLWYQNRAGGSGTSPFSTGTTSGQTSATGDTGSSGAAPDTSSADLLSALAGENQQLLGSLLSSAQGLRSLAGASVGAPTNSLTAGEPSSVTSFVPQAAVPDNQVNVGTAAQGPNLSQTTPLYVDPSTGSTYAVGPSGAAEPAYPYGSGYVAPETYAGLGVTPDAITGPGAPSGTISGTPPQPISSATVTPGQYASVYQPAPAPKPPSSAQPYSAKTGAIRAGRAG